MHSRIGNSGLRRGSGSPAPSGSSTPTPVALSPGWTQAKPRVGLSRPARKATPSASQKHTQTQITPVEQQSQQRHRDASNESKENAATVTANVSSIAAVPIPAVPSPAAACLPKRLSASVSPLRGENRPSNSPANGKRSTALLSPSKSPRPPSAAAAAVCASPLPSIPPSPDEDAQHDVSAMHCDVSLAATPNDRAATGNAPPASAPVSASVSAPNSQPLQLSPHILATPEPAVADPNQSMVCIPETPNVHNTSTVAAAVDSTIRAAARNAAAPPSSMLSPPTLAAAAPVPSVSSGAAMLVTPKPSRHRGGGARRKHRVPSSLPLPLVFSPEEQTQEDVALTPLPPSMNMQLAAESPSGSVGPILQPPPLQDLKQESVLLPAVPPAARSRRRTKVEPQLSSMPAALTAAVAPSAPYLCSSASDSCMAAPLPLLSSSLDPHDLLLSDCHAMMALKHMEDFEQAEAQESKWAPQGQQQQPPQVQHATATDVKPTATLQQHQSPQRSPHRRRSRMDDASFVDEDAPSFVAPDMMTSRPLQQDPIVPARAGAPAASMIAPPIAFSLPSATPSTPPRNSQLSLSGSGSGSGSSPSRHRFPATDPATRAYYLDLFRSVLRHANGSSGVTLDRAVPLESFIESRVRQEGRDYEPMANEILRALKHDQALARELCISIGVPELVARLQPGVHSPATPLAPAANGPAAFVASPEVQVIAPPAPHVPPPAQRSGKFFKKIAKAASSSSAGASAVAASAATSAPASPAVLSGVDAEFVAGPTLPAPAPPPPPPPARRAHGILAYTSPTAKSAAEQLQEKDAVEFARQKAKQDAAFAAMAQQLWEAEQEKARKEEERAAAEAEHLALIRANKAVSAGHSPARSGGGSGSRASNARTPQTAKSTFSIFSRFAADAAGGGAVMNPRTPQQRSPVISPLAAPSLPCHPLTSAAAPASAAATSPVTPSREFPNRQLHFTTPEQQLPSSSHAPLQLQHLQPMSPLLPLPALGFGSTHAKFEPMQLSEVSEGKELALSLSPPEQQHMEPAQNAKLERMPDALPAAALSSALPVLSDPPALEQPSIQLHAKPEHAEAQPGGLIPTSVPVLAVSACSYPVQPPHAAAVVEDSAAQSRKRRMPATPPPAETAPASPLRAVAAAAASGAVASPQPALQHGMRSAESFLTPARAPAHHPLLVPPTPQVFTSPLSAPPSDHSSSSNSNSSGMHTPSLAQRRPPSITPGAQPVLRTTTPDVGDYEEEPEYNDDAGVDGAFEDAAQEVVDATAPGAAHHAGASTKRKQRVSGGGECGGPAGKKKRKSSTEGVASTVAAPVPADASSSTDLLAQPASVLATSNPHAALARRLKSRAKKVGAGGASSAGPSFRGPARGCWTHTAEGLKIYICRADGLQYTGPEAMRRAQEDERAAQTRKGLTAVAAPSATPAGGASASQIDLTTLQSPSSRSPSAAPAAAAPASTPIAALHSLSDWHIPQCIVDAYAEAGLTSLYDWQVDCLSLPGVLEGSSNIVYSASTSAGKTLVAEVLVINRMLGMAPAAQAALEALHAATGAAGRASLGCNRKVLFVLPYVAIVDEKVRDLAQKLSRAGFAIKAYHGQQSSTAQIEAGFTICAAPGAAPNPITGAVSCSSREMNRLGEEIDIGVVVIEKANVLLSALKRENRMGKLAAVVVDELHMISSGGGPDVDDLSQPSASTAASAVLNAKRGNPQSFAQNRGYHIELFLAKIQEWNSRHRAPSSSSSASSPVAPALPIQIIGLSATLPNMDLFAQWLSPCALYSTEFRPVHLKESILCRGVLYVKRENPEWVAEMERQREAARLAGTEGQPPQPPGPARVPPRFVFDEEQRLTPSLISKQTKHNQAELEKLSQSSAAASNSRGGSGSNSTRARPPTAEQIVERELMVDLIESTILPGTCLGGSGSGLVTAGSRSGGGGGVLVFCSSKGHTETMAGAIARSLRRRAQVREFGYIQTKARGTTSKQKTLDSFVATASSTSPLKHGGLPDSEMQQRRQMLLQRLAGASECVDECLRRTVPHGVGFHHSGLTGDERQLIEGAFRAGTLSVICCTSTLAAGVNLPARRVLFEGIRVAQSLISLTQYQQMSGRAGRKGMQEEGSSIVIAHNERDLESIKSIMNQALPQLKSALDMDAAASGCDDMIPAAGPAAAASCSTTVAPPSAPPKAANPYLSHGLLDHLSTSAAGSGPTSVLACPSVGRESLACFLGHTLLAHQKAAKEATKNKKAALLAQVRSHAATAWGQQQPQHQAHQPHVTGASSSLPQLPSSLQSEMDLCMRYLVSRNLAEGVFDTTGSFLGRATDLGLAIVEAGLGPREGLRLYSELSLMRTQGFVSGSSLHLCWLLTPEPSIAYWRAMESESAHWERIHARFELMHTADPERKMDLEVCKRIPFPKSIKQMQQQQQQQLQTSAQPTPQRIPPHQPQQPLRSHPPSNLMGPPPTRFGAASGSAAATRPAVPTVAASFASGSPLCISNPDGVKRVASLFHDFVAKPDRPRPDCPQLLAYLRLYHAMVLQDLLDDSLPLSLLSSRTQLTRGELQRRLAEATMLCNQLITLCERLGWRDFSLVLELYRERLAHGGAPPELLGLMRLPGVKIGRARMLHKAGFDSVDKVAQHATPEMLVEIFARNTAYRGAVAAPNTSMRADAASASAAAASADAAAPPPSQAARVKRSILQQQEAVQICHDARRLVQQQQQQPQQQMM